MERLYKLLDILYWINLWIPIIFGSWLIPDDITEKWFKINITIGFIMYSVIRNLPRVKDYMSNIKIFKRY